jgi:hypothetical protein
VTGLEAREMMTKHEGFTSYGSIGHQSLNLMNQAWATMEHRFSVATQTHNDKYSSAKGASAYEGPRYALNLLNRHPVDLLVIETGSKARNWRKTPECRWETLVLQTSRDKRPQYVIESWLPQVQLRTAWMGQNGDGLRIPFHRNSDQCQIY